MRKAFYLSRQYLRNMNLLLYGIIYSRWIYFWSWRDLIRIKWTYYRYRLWIVQAFHTFYAFFWSFFWWRCRASFFSSSWCCFSSNTLLWIFLLKIWFASVRTSVVDVRLVLTSPPPWETSRLIQIGLLWGWRLGASGFALSRHYLFPSAMHPSWFKLSAI